MGIQHGYAGLIAGNVVPLGARDVSGIIQQGGTLLGSARCPEFKAEAARLQALRMLRQHEIEAVIVIGGNGSQVGAYALSQLDFPVIGVASTIDNDLYGSDITIGVDTALNIALEAIDRLKVTASSHERAFLIEVMGHGCGYLALMAGIAGGAEAIVIPEVETDPEGVATELRSAYERGKAHALVVVAEGAHYNAAALARYFQEHHERLGLICGTTLTSGGAPSAHDRVLAPDWARTQQNAWLAASTGYWWALSRVRLRPHRWPRWWPTQSHSISVCWNWRVCWQDERRKSATGTG
jgi:6-phosphofructokinase 1